MTWVKKLTEYCDDLLVNEKNINHIFIAGQAWTGSTYVMALHKSLDGGQSWNTYKITTDYGDGLVVATDPNNDEVIYVGGYYQDGQTYRSGLFKTTNGGSDWTQIGKDITSWVYAIAIKPDSSNKIYVGTDSGIYMSEDSGSSWTKVSSFDVNCIKINSSLTSEIFAGGWNGVYYSEDGGNTWEALNEGLTCTAILSLDMDVPGKILYAGTYGGSAYKNNLLNLYSLIINATSGGTTDPSPGTYKHEPAKEITIRALPNANSRFSHWSGDIPQGHETDNPITITMDTDRSITANFVYPCTLTIASGTGGTTDPVPGNYTHDSGTQVTISAIPNSGYRFSGWSGDASGTTNPITITMDGDKSVTANFIRQYTLTIASGTGGTTDPAPGSYPYDSGAQVMIRAIANSGYQFSGWSGAVTGTTNPVTIAMDGDKSITASFKTASPGGDGTEKKGGCFIATAAYGSPLHPQVKILRDFRDTYLLPNKIGRALVRFYYRHSPAAADFIARHRVLRVAVQTILVPVVAFSYSVLRLGPGITGAILALILCLSILFVRLRRKRDKISQNKNKTK